MDIISVMRNSDSELLKAESQDIAKWSKLKHTKDDLELFLNFNIAQIKFKTKDGEDRTIICTSNRTLVKLFSISKEEDKKKMSCSISSGIRTKDKRSVDTWDLEDNSRKTIMLNSWMIENFISITPENILLLDALVAKLLNS